MTIQNGFINLLVKIVKKLWNFLTTVETSRNSTPLYGIECVLNVETNDKIILQQGIQSTLTNKVLRKSGCLFLTLLKWAEVECNVRWSLLDIERVFISTGIINLVNPNNAFINDNLRFMNFLLDKNHYQNFIRKNEVINPDMTQIVGLSRVDGGTHFILRFKDGSTWDSLPPERPAAKTWTPSNYRIFT